MDSNVIKINKNLDISKLLDYNILINWKRFGIELTYYSKYKIQWTIHPLAYINNMYNKMH